MVAEQVAAGGGQESAGRGIDREPSTRRCTGDARSVSGGGEGGRKGSSSYSPSLSSSLSTKREEECRLWQWGWWLSMVAGMHILKTKDTDRLCV